MDESKIVEKLKSGSRIYGTSIVATSSLWPELIKNANLDFIFIDTEHIPHGRETVSNLCKIYSALNILPIVRISSPDPYSACMTLDGGASAVLAPYIESEDQVKKLVGAVKFRPLKGELLNAILNNQESISPKLDAYIKNRCRNNLLFLNIESVPAINNLETILSVNGIDGIIIGPHDLSCSLEIPEEYDNSLFEQNVKTIIHKCRNRNISVGIHLSEEPEYQIKWAKEGANIILHSSDMTMFYRKLKSDFYKIKTELNEYPNHINDNSIII
ncbi:MAG: aldolase [Ignavibacteriae bacterium]|nr:aldolase [Ignavibacteriota bacterium]